MKHRLLTVLALIVIAPLAVAGWLGARIVRDERALVEHRMQGLVRAQLRAVGSDVNAVLREYGGAIVSEMNREPEVPGTLRGRAAESPYVRQFYLLDADGRMIHPSLDDPGGLSAAEADALERTLRIWESRALSDAGDDGAESARSKLPGLASRQEATAPRPRWYAWYWDDGLQLMVWYRAANGIVHAAELERVRLLSEIVAALPDTDPTGSELGGRLTLVDSQGATLYQWGEYELPEDARPFETLALDPPLSAWTLEYYTPEGALGTAAAGGLLLNLLGGLALFSAVVIGSGFYVYREHTREMREAAQRVSFVNQVSHELKTPLTNIRMYAEMLEGEVPPGDERSRSHIGVVVAESQRLSRLISNILTFSRQQRKTLEINRRPGIVDEVLRDCLDHFRPALEAKGIEAEFDAGASRQVDLDRDILEQIMGNLIGNVEKYAADGGLLKVTSKQDGERVTVLVADAGEGIPPRERERIFQPFYRIDDKLTEGVAGTGIGLSIARELARLHGGDLENAPSSKGACFRLTFLCPPVAGGVS